MRSTCKPIAITQVDPGADAANRLSSDPVTSAINREKDEDLPLATGKAGQPNISIS
ncbi:hypothetical protein FRC06_005436 [Ceratobasidium sp. 370]|nr:hypothetical protein FRC06_005436 [Ceratobasidium sp. 370]